MAHGHGEELELDDLSEVYETRRELPYVEYITGRAGTGKTHLIRQRVADDPKYGILTSSTGISAVNLGCSTIHSTLGYYDTPSLRNSFERGHIHSKLRKIAQSGVRNIILDELSMLDADQLTIIHMAIDDVNQYKSVKHPLGFIAVGDFMQLRPVKAEYAFKSEVWPRFADNTTKLTKMWRQSDPAFLDALNYLRMGDGSAAAEILGGITQFHRSLDDNFEGTTVVGLNKEADNYNRLRLLDLKEPNIVIRSQWWGKRDNGAWNNIPEEASVKVGAYVMLLANEREDGKIVYANGDTARIREFDGKSFHCELVRNGEVVRIYPIHRTRISREEPLDENGQPVAEEEWETFDSSTGERPPYGQLSYDENLEVWHIGGIRFFPMRLAWASTTHRTQGLSLDKVQVDLRGRFMGEPSMVYVAMSRARSPEGLRIVGSPEMLVSRCNIDEQVRPWL